jgi:hypothetical protein
MVKVKWGVSGADIDEIEPDEVVEYYDGPTPPRGVYRFEVKSVEYVKYTTGSKGIKIFLVVNENRKEKKRYNGAPTWENVIDLEATAFKIRQWLDAIGAEGKDWDATVIDGNNMVTKIGRVKMEGLFVRAATKLGKNNNDEQRMEIARFLPFNTETGDGEGDSTGDDGEEEAPF